MTLAEMEALDREFITVAEAASVMGCAPQRLRDGLDLYPEAFPFPHYKIGHRHRIMRVGFVRWAMGEKQLPTDDEDGSQHGQ